MQEQVLLMADHSKVICNRYVLMQKLGEGGFGAVYQAKDIKLSRKVAVKILHANLSQDQRQIKRFLKEARLISALKNPHTLTLFDCGEDEDGNIFLITELLEGISLDHRLKKAPLSARECCHIFIPICDALAEAC